MPADKAAASSRPSSPQPSPRRPEAASTKWRAVVDQIWPKVPKLFAILDDAEPDVLAYMTFPKGGPGSTATMEIMLPVEVLDRHYAGASSRCPYPRNHAARIKDMMEAEIITGCIPRTSNRTAPTATPIDCDKK